MPLQATSGAASYDAFGGGVPVVPNYIEEVFSTYLYAGTNTTTSFNNGIDLSTYGGMTWIKCRNDPRNSAIFDTSRGVNKWVSSNLSTAQTTTSGSLTAFNTNGFTVSTGLTGVNGDPSINFASWTFRKQPKFFDVVTYTGTGSNTTIAHNLGSVPGCIFVKRTDTSSSWQVYHRSLGNTQYIVLNLTARASTDTTRWNSTTPTSSVFSIGTDATVNASGGTYVAYIFAHDAGGFGLTGTDNVISCGSFTTDGSSQFAQVNLGYEPQFVLIKNSDGGPDNWKMFDNMRRLSVQASTAINNATLFPNLSNAETIESNIQPNATGFISTTTNSLEVNASFIYIAIRRGPMKVPTTGTSVFGMSARSGTGANATVTGGQTDDVVLIKNRGAAVGNLLASRLTDIRYAETSSTAEPTTASTTILQANPWDVMDGVKVGTTSTITNASANTYINYLFKRAPSFMDVVFYTGTGANTTQPHNLGVVPELIIVKRTDAVSAWDTYSASIAASQYLVLNTTAARASGATRWNSTRPTSSVFSLGTNITVNNSGGTYLAYLFATCAGVSKVGSYTGNGTTQTVDCGITAGARFVLIKRTDAVSAWYIYDTARGMTVLTDPYWLANTTAAEVATLGSVTTVATGFAVDATILTAINTSSATYIFLAIA